MYSFVLHEFACEYVCMCEVKVCIDVRVLCMCCVRVYRHRDIQTYRHSQKQTDRQRQTDTEEDIDRQTD